ncbi:hypothetical protein ACKI10_46855, partial [Streptomyces galilaeus]|uniref:hypothetical protein n=1 Tax=Streptomyces galilaeus TaxID=33899 RepID=UPI0038F61679
KEYADAMEDLTKAISLHPTGAEAYYFRALCKFFSRDISGSCTDLKKAVDLGSKPALLELSKSCK